jgi:hypothetical protein
MNVYYIKSASHRNIKIKYLYYNTFLIYMKLIINFNQ